MKQPCSLSQVYSMISSIKSFRYLYEIVTGENRVGSEWKRREKEKESGRLAVLGRSIGQKWKLHGLEKAVRKKGHLSILATEIKRINRI